MGKLSPILTTVIYIALATQLLPVVLYLFFKKRIGDKLLQVIFLLELLSFFLNLFALYQSANNQNTYQVFNVFLLTETVLLLFYFSQILESITFKKLIYGFLALFCSTWIFLLFKTGLKTNFEFLKAIEAFAIIIASIYYYYEHLRKSDDIFIHLRPTFWIVTAYFINTTGTFFLFLFLDSLPQDQQLKYFILSPIFNIIKTVLLSVAMFMKNDTKKLKFQLQ